MIFILDCLLKSLVVLMVAVIGARVMRNRPAADRHLLWVGAVLMMKLAHSWLVEHDPQCIPHFGKSLPSILQNAIAPLRSEREGSRSRLLLCGSAMTFMGTLLSGSAPLRGRAGLELVVPTLDYQLAAQFWNLTDPALAIKKSASPGSFDAVGTTIHYSFLVTNTGNVTLTGVKINDLLPGLSAVACPSATLNPGNAITCTASYVTTAADLRARSVSNTATVTGDPPTGAPVVSGPSTVLIAATAPVHPGTPVPVTG